MSGSTGRLIPELSTTQEEGRRLHALILKSRADIHRWIEPRVRGGVGGRSRQRGVTDNSAIHSRPWGRRVLGAGDGAGAWVLLYAQWSYVDWHSGHGARLLAYPNGGSIELGERTAGKYTVTQRIDAAPGEVVWIPGWTHHRSVPSRSLRTAIVVDCVYPPGAE